MKLSKVAVFLTCVLGAMNANALLISGIGGAQSDPLVAGGTTATFDALAPGVFSSITDNGVTVAGIGADLTVGSDFIGTFNTRGTQSVYNDFDLIPDEFRIDFAGGTDAFTFNWGAADNEWLMSAFTAGGVLIEQHIIGLANPSSNAGDYFGIAAAGIGYVTLQDQHNNIQSGDFVFIDDVTYNGGSAVPAPGAIALVGLGLLLLGFSRKRA